MPILLFLQPVFAASGPWPPLELERTATRTTMIATTNPTATSAARSVTFRFAPARGDSG
jgi:hypothetical protein